MLDRPITINSIIGARCLATSSPAWCLISARAGPLRKPYRSNAAQRSIVGDDADYRDALHAQRGRSNLGTDPYIQITLISNDAGACNANVHAIWAGLG